jgi:hypothetical protein
MRVVTSNAERQLVIGFVRNLENVPWVIKMDGEIVHLSIPTPSSRIFLDVMGIYGDEKSASRIPGPVVGIPIRINVVNFARAKFNKEQMVKRPYLAEFLRFNHPSDCEYCRD